MLRLTIFLLFLAAPFCARSNMATFIVGLSSSPTIRHLLKMLDITPSISGAQLIDNIASLKTGNSRDSLRQREVLDFLASDDDISRTAINQQEDTAASMSISDLVRLAHRYGEGANRHLFLYPLRWSLSDGEGMVIPVTPESPAIRKIIDRIPQHDRRALTDILEEGLARYGFDVPLPEDINRVPDEELALWALLLRTSDGGSWPWRRLAEAALELMASGQSTNFFHPSNGDYPIYQYFFTKRGVFGIADRAALFEDAAAMRRANPHQSVHTILQNQDQDIRSAAIPDFLKVGPRTMVAPLRLLLRRNRGP